MDLVAFGQELQALTLPQIRALAADIHLASETTADQVTATRALLVVEGTLRRTRRQQHAGLAALAAATAVQDAASRGGATLPDDDVTCVARSAARIARAFVAEDALRGGAPGTEIECLTRGWRRLAALSRDPELPRGCARARP